LDCVFTATQVEKDGEIISSPLRLRASPLAAAEMKTRTHFAHTVDRLDDAGNEIIEQLAGAMARADSQAAAERLALKAALFVPDVPRGTPSALCELPSGPIDAPK
jgi:hypothetical protein